MERLANLVITLEAIITRSGVNGINNINTAKIVRLDLINWEGFFERAEMEMATRNLRGFQGEPEVNDLNSEIMNNVWRKLLSQGESLEDWDMYEVNYAELVTENENENEHKK